MITSYKRKRVDDAKLRAGLRRVDVGLRNRQRGDLLDRRGLGCPRDRSILDRRHLGVDEALDAELELDRTGGEPRRGLLR